MRTYKILACQIIGQAAARSVPELFLSPCIDYRVNNLNLTIWAASLESVRLRARLAHHTRATEK